MELTPEEDHQLEHYLQGHIHPDVQPMIRRAIKTDVFTFAGYLAAVDLVQLNHDAIDGQLMSEESQHVT